MEFQSIGSSRQDLGILALLGNHRENEFLRPDYSVSFLHVFIGVLAHSLLDQKRVEILCHALGHSAPDGQPSWIIDWNSPKWPAHCDFQNQAELAFRSWADLLRVRPPRDDLTPAQQNLLSVPSGLQTPMTEKCIISKFSTQHKSRWRMNSLSESPQSIFCHPRPRSPEENWDCGAAVNASTGSLTINLTRICEFPHVPSKVYTYDGMTVFEVQGAVPGEAWMYLITNIPLDHLVTPTKDHLFLLDQGDEKSFVLLILRKLDDSPVFRLIGCCYGLYFRFTDPSNPPRDTELFLPELRSRHSLDKIFQFYPGWELLEGLPHIQPNTIDDRQLNTHMHELLGGPDLISPQAYCNFIHPRFHPVVNGEHVEITMHPANWHSLLDCESLLEFIGIYTELRLEGESDWTSSKRLLYRPLASLDHKEVDKVEASVRYNRPLHLRVTHGKLLSSMDDFRIAEALSGTRSRCRSDARFYMPPERIVGEEDGMLTCPAWPREVLEGFTIDGRMYRTCIA